MLAGGFRHVRAKGTFSQRSPLPAVRRHGYSSRSAQSNPMTVVGGIGLEPTTFAMSTQRSNQLS